MVSSSVRLALIAKMTASLVTNSGLSDWVVGALMLLVYLTCAMPRYLLPPRGA